MRLFLSFLGLCLAPSLLVGQQPNSPHSAQPLQRLEGSLHPRARAEYEGPRLSPSRRIDGASLHFKRTAEQQAALDDLLAEQQNPNSSQYRHWLTPEEFGRRFGASDAQIAAARQWLEDNSLHVDSVSPSRDSLRFSGNVETIERALHTELHQYTLHGETHFANNSEPSLPQSIAAFIDGVRNLNDFRPRTRAHAMTLAPNFTSGLSGTTALSANDINLAYSGWALPLTHPNPAIAVVGQTEINDSDIMAYSTLSGALFFFTRVLVPASGTPVTRSGDEVEADLDIELAGGVSGNGTIDYVYVGSAPNYSVYDSLQYAITANVAPIITMSYGDCEANVPQVDKDTLRRLAQQANAQGQTILVASGDWGPATCDYPANNTPVTAATHGLQADIPASIPEITAVGGTTITGDLNGAAPNYWSQGTPVDVPNSRYGASILAYIPESAWNDTVRAGTVLAGGGGISTYYPRPAWQTPPPGLDGTHRLVPDIAMPASPLHDAYLICNRGSCVNGFRDSNWSFRAVGGTSASSPAMAGLLARIEGYLGVTGMGNINPRLYQTAATSAAASAFHDITSGDILVPCTASPDCPPSGIFGYSAAPGYDLATGLGSVDAFGLAQAWNSANAGKAPTSIALQSTPQGSSTYSFTATLTATGSNAVPQAGITFYVDGVSLNGYSTAPGQWQASYPLTAGRHAVAAFFPGDSNLRPFSSLASPLFIDVPASANPSFSVVVHGQAPPLTAGNPISMLVYVAANGSGFTGNVNLTCSVAPSGAFAGGLVPGCGLGQTTLAITQLAGAPATNIVVSLGTATVAGLPRNSRAMPWLAATSGMLAFVWVLPAGTLRRRSQLTTCALALCFFGCGGGGGSSNKSLSTTAPTPPPQNVVHPGAYTVTVTGTDAASGRSAFTSFVVTVQ